MGAGVGVGVRPGVPNREMRSCSSSLGLLSWRGTELVGSERRHLRMREMSRCILKRNETHATENTSH